MEEVEDPSLARGCLRVQVIVDTTKSLVSGCWLPRKQNQDTWVEFRYERLQDFCYRCGRIGRMNTECSFEPRKSGSAGFGEWIKTAPVRAIQENPRPAPNRFKERRLAGMTISVTRKNGL